MRKAHVSPKKKQAAHDFEQLLLEYPIIAAVNLENLPAKQLAVMRDKLRDSCTIRMTKKRVMKIAIEKVKDKRKGIEQLEAHIKGMPALLFTKQNPFTLFKTVKRSKSKAAAKPGQKAPYDIVVPAGPTNFAPGPVIGELGALGIKTGVENGKVAIKADAIVAKEGAVISAKLSSVLLRLGIEPMEIGLDITAVFEDGMIMTRSVLDVDEEQYLGMLVKGAAEAIALSIETSFLMPETRERAVQQAARQAGALAIETKQSPESGLNLSEAELALYTALTSGPVASAAAADTPSAKAEEQKEEKNEESAAEGLGNLFG